RDATERTAPSAPMPVARRSRMVVMTREVFAHSGVAMEVAMRHVGTKQAPQHYHGHPVQDHHGGSDGDFPAQDYIAYHGVAQIGNHAPPVDGSALSAPVASPASTPAPHSGMTAVIGGDAAAVGNQTSATGVVTNTIENHGNYTIAEGEAIF